MIFYDVSFFKSLVIQCYQMFNIGLNLDIFLGIIVPTPAFTCTGSACDGKISFEDATSLDPGNYESDFKLEVKYLKCVAMF